MPPKLLLSDDPLASKYGLQTSKSKSSPQIKSQNNYFPASQLDSQFNQKEEQYKDLIPASKLDFLGEEKPDILEPGRPPGLLRQVASIPEVTLSMMAKGELAEPIIGYAGLAKLASAQSADEANQVMQELRAKIYPYLRVRTKGGKAAEEAVVRGAGQIFSPIVEGLKEKILKPATEAVSGGGRRPVAAGLTAAILSTIPELAATYGGHVTGATWRGTKSGLRKIGNVIGIPPNISARYAPTFRRITASRRAAEWFRENLGPLNSVQAKKARWLQEKTGVKFDLAGFSNDPKIISALKVAEDKSSVLNDILQSNRRKNIEIIRNHIRNIKSPGDSERFFKVVGADRAAREFSLKFEQAEMGKKIDKLQKGYGPEEAGKITREQFIAEEKAARASVKEYFDRVPDDLIMDTDNLVNELIDILEPTSKAELLGKTVPPEVRKGLQYFVDNEGQVTVKELYNIRRTWNDELRDMFNSSRRNRTKERRMIRAIKALDEAMKNTEFQPGVSAELFKQARQAHFEKVVKRFENPSVRRAQSNFTQNSFVSDAELGGLFFRKGNSGIAAAADFKKAAGANQNAFKAMRAFIDDSLLNKVYDFNTREVSSANLKKWLADHRQALKEFGWLDDYNKMYEVQKRIDNAHTHLEDFQKLRASQMLGTDPGKEMEVFLSSKTPAKDIFETVKEFGGDPDVKASLKNAFIDQILEVGIENANDIKTLDKLYQDMKPAYNVLFSGEPEKLRAMLEYRESMRAIYPKGDLKANYESMGKIFQNYFRDPIMARRIRDVITYTVIRALPDWGKDKILNIIYEGALDPEFAYLLKQSGKDIRTKPKTVRQNIRRYFLKVAQPALVRGIAEASEKEEK